MDYVALLLELAQVGLLGYLGYKLKPPEPRELVKRILVEKMAEAGGRDRLRARLLKKLAERKAKQGS